VCHRAHALPDYAAPDAASVAYAVSMAYQTTRGFPMLPRKKQITECAPVTKVVCDESGASLHFMMPTFGEVDGRVRDQ
jgi:hypothetical protein